MADYKCAKCDGVAYEDGMISYGEGFGFIANNKPWYSYSKPIAGRACTACGHMELYVDVGTGNGPAGSRMSLITKQPGKIIFVVLFAAIFIFIVVRSLFFSEHRQTPDATIPYTQPHN